MLLPRTLLCTLIVSLFLLNTDAAQAHRVRLFAYESGGNISVEAAFSGGKPAKMAEILVHSSPSELVLLTGQTNEEGLFTFPIPEKAREMHTDLKIIINIGEGHKNHWMLKAEDYLDTSPSSSPLHPSPTITKAEEEGEDFSPSIQIEQALLQKVVEESLDRKLAPIKRMLAENLDRKPRLHDILGGIGYLLGLAGLVAYFRSKKNTVTKHDG